MANFDFRLLATDRNFLQKVEDFLLMRRGFGFEKSAKPSNDIGRQLGEVGQGAALDLALCVAYAKD